MKKNKLGLWSIVLLGVNAIIGSGIFLLPNKAYSLVGTNSILAFVFNALLAVSIALCFAEVSGLFKKNGGPYVYAKEAFGDFVGFEVGFIKWIISMIAWATMANGFATALGEIFPVCKDGSIQIAIMSLLIIGLTLLNLVGVSAAKWTNNIATICKIIPLLVFVLVGLFFMNGANFQPVSMNKLSNGNFAQACLLLFYAFTGFEAIAVSAEDMENPQKNLPKAILIVMLIVSCFYILIQVVAIGVLGPDLKNHAAPIQDAMYTFLGKPGLMLVAAGTLISILGINVASSFITPRSAVALADDHMLPAFMNKRNDKDVPYYSVLISGAITLIIALSGSFTTLAAISVVSRFAQYIPTCLSVIVFRKKMKDKERAFTIPFGPIIPIIAVLVSIWLLAHADLYKLEIGLGGLIVAIPFYFIMKKINRKKG